MGLPLHSYDRPTDLPPWLSSLPVESTAPEEPIPPMPEPADLPSWLTGTPAAEPAPVAEIPAEPLDLLACRTGSARCRRLPNQLPNRQPRQKARFPIGMLLHRRLNPKSPPRPSLSRHLWVKVCLNGSHKCPHLRLASPQPCLNPPLLNCPLRWALNCRHRLPIFSSRASRAGW